MCLYPTRIENPRYKNMPNVHPAIKYVTAKCGMCYECRKARAAEWRQRLEEEMRQPRYPGTTRLFITFTISNEVAQKYGVNYVDATLEERVSEETYAKENAMMKDLVKKWRHSVDKKKIKQRHFFVTEHGEDDSLRIHLHGIVWVKEEDVERMMASWTAGRTDRGNIRDSTIGYLCKYMHKMPKVHKHYRSIVLCSPGIGSGMVERYKQIHPEIEKQLDIDPKYRYKNGVKVSMCDYYKRKLFTRKQIEDRRRKLWKEQRRWVMGIEYKLSDRESARAYTRKMVTEQASPPLGMKPRPKKE